MTRLKRYILAKQKAQAAWRAACEWQHIDPSARSSTFVAFDDANPHLTRLNRAAACMMRNEAFLRPLRLAR